MIFCLISQRLASFQNLSKQITEKSCLLALLLLGNSLYWHKNLLSRFYGSTLFVNYFLNTGNLITWTSPYWTLNFRPKVHVLLSYLDFLWLRCKFIWLTA
jgi:hypothetical protein